MKSERRIFMAAACGLDIGPRKLAEKLRETRRMIGPGAVILRAEPNADSVVLQLLSKTAAGGAVHHLFT